MTARLKVKKIQPSMRVMGARLKIKHVLASMGVTVAQV